jgi:hypothetical protein
LRPSTVQPAHDKTQLSSTQHYFVLRLVRPICLWIDRGRNCSTFGRLFRRPKVASVWRTCGLTGSLQQLHQLLAQALNSHQRNVFSLKHTLQQAVFSVRGTCGLTVSLQQPHQLLAQALNSHQRNVFSLKHTLQQAVFSVRGTCGLTVSLQQPQQLLP